VFVFENCCLAQDASACIQGRDHPLFEGTLSAEQQERYIFSVFKCNLKHERHICPSLPSQRGMFMSYQVTQEVADMASAGATPAAIINFLTRSGQRGMISAAKVHHLRATIQSDIDVYSSIRPSTRDSHGQVLLNMLDQRRRQKKDVDYIFLYTEFDEKLVQTIANGDEDEVEFQSIRMQTGHGDDGGLSSSDAPPEPSSWLASLSHFFTERWSRLSATVRLPPSRDKKKNAWLPADRIINIRGHKCVLLAIMWCTEAEKLLFAKYPEVAGHDTKAGVCSMSTPYYYCIGIRDNLHTFVIFRGLVSSETLGMFMFISHTAWVYLHGKKNLLALRANICDGKDEQIRALKSMTLRDGLARYASMLRCGWHIENRGMHRIFGSASQDWQRAFEKFFWMWQSVETMEALENMRQWLVEICFNSEVVQRDMSASQSSKFLPFVDSIWSTRGEWALSHNLEVQAFDTRVNTFTESNFSVLTQHVGVSASMSATSFVRREDLSHVSRLNKLAYAVHRDATRSYSHVVTTEWTQRFAVAEAVMLSKPLEILKNQVLLGASCARSDRTKISKCTKHDCNICAKYLTSNQKGTLTSATTKIHLLCFVDEELTKKVRFANLPHDYVELLRTVPIPKEWRVVTCNFEEHGCRLLCSCGYGCRNMTCCLHVSLVLQKASNYQCFGCEEEAIHIRHTNLYSAVRLVGGSQR
jgi:hypothetical protein